MKNTIEKLYESVCDKRPPSGSKYWEDECPVCGKLATSACRCPINERTCDNNHTWHYEGGNKVLGKGH